MNSDGNTVVFENILLFKCSFSSLDQLYRFPFVNAPVKPSKWPGQLLCFARDLAKASEILTNDCV